ncbi:MULTISPECIES: VOC family protein [Rhodococcus]|jgi:predicted enzyme related to lactoylglutathione lyase|uniref:VOC family protein n=1 Tax=Rhodococcus TaxID=1827 RepID=UPI001C461E9E|nr:VOC family protein [Rhodococcus opacus]MBV6761742.1 VOC family protein [Rhodococcus opacus]
MTEQATVGNVLYPVSDVDAAVKFYESVLNLRTKFQDGSRFAALDGGKVTVAIAGAEEDVTGGLVAASFKVGDVSAAVEEAVAQGATIVRESEEGPHETRAVVRDPWGNAVVLYAPTPQ